MPDFLFSMTNESWTDLQAMFQMMGTWNVSWEVMPQRINFKDLEVHEYDIDMRHLICSSESFDDVTQRPLGWHIELSNTGHIKIGHSDNFENQNSWYCTSCCVIDRTISSLNPGLVQEVKYIDGAITWKYIHEINEAVKYETHVSLLPNGGHLTYVISSDE